MELGPLKMLYDITLKDATKLLKTFAKLDTNHDGTIDEKDFAHLLGVPNSGYTRSIFRMFDEDHNGVLDLREFVIGLSILSAKTSATESIEFAFKTLDREKKVV